MGFIREPEGVDFVITPSQTAKEDITFISDHIQTYKTQERTNAKEIRFQQNSRSQPSRVKNQ